MFERFTDRARRVVVLAQEEARLLNHNYIGTEHILLGLIHEGEGVAAGALESLGINLDSARRRVVEIIGQGAQSPRGHIPFTPRAKKVLELSLQEALQLGHNSIGTEHMLLGLVREGEGVAAQVLQDLRADLPGVRQAVIQQLSGKSEVRWELAPSPVHPPFDRIELRGIRVFARHGALSQEQQEGQEFLVDLTIQADLARAGSSDDLADTVDYCRLAERVAERVAGERWDLLERVAQRVAELVLEDERARSVEVTVHKPGAPLPVPVEDVSVTVARRR
ncbi:MAG: dihydroneopterin aldolase [Actinomycetota bacterium]|nr:dihydroneopterin aldolase [Actinomycetota bacterium]